MAGLKELFETHYIEVPEEKYDVIDGLFEENEQLESNLNEQIQSNIELKKQLLAYEAGNIFANVSEGLSDVEVSKFASLAEGVDFESLDQYQEKLNILKGSYFNTVPTTNNMLVEETTNKQITQNISSSMNAYMSTLDRIAKQNKI
jgi:ribosomal protein S13